MRRFWSFVGIFLSLTILLLGPLSAAESAAEKSSAESLLNTSLRQALQDGRYADARQAIDEAAKAADAAHDELAYWKGWSFYLEKQYDAAIGEFEQFEKRFAKSAWLRRARFAKALSLLRRGDAKAAELIYRAEAEFLLSAERRAELAAIYLEFADKYFKPAEEGQKPDYAKALEFYRKALQIGPHEEKRIEIELRAAQCSQMKGDWEPAAAGYAAFSADHPKHALEIEARFRLGETRLAQGQLREARRAWQDMLNGLA